MKNKNHQLLAACIFVIATAWLVTAAPQSKPSNSKVVKKLREIVKIHEQIEQNQRLIRTPATYVEAGTDVRGRLNARQQG